MTTRTHGSASPAPATREDGPRSRDVCVVIQGPVMAERHRLAPRGITQEVLDCARAQLPEAQIVLSTWRGQPRLDARAADQVIASDDPGAERFYPPDARPLNPLNNGNRLIVSTQAGLDVAARPYVLKLRSDLALYGRDFLALMHRYARFDAPWRAVQARILAFPIYSLRFEERGGRRVPRPYHVSDWCQFGLREDVRAFYDCPLMPEPQTSQWFATRRRLHPTLWPERLWRYSPEQYLTSRFAWRALGLRLEDGDQADAETIDASRRFIANNFAVLDQSQWQALSLKLLVLQPLLPAMIHSGLYSHAAWQRDYDELVLGQPPEPEMPAADYGPAHPQRHTLRLALEAMAERHGDFDAFWQERVRAVVGAQPPASPPGTAHAPRP